MAVAAALAGCAGEPAALPLGQEAVFEHAPVAGGTNGPRTTLGVTVLAVRTGSFDELEAAGFEIEEDQREKTPIYVDVRFENKGSETIDRELGVSLRDQDDEIVSPVVIFNYGDITFELCPDTSEGELAPGESYQHCELFFLDPGREARRVTFLQHVPGEESQFLHWATS
jgi:hypothetical protein